MKEQDIIGHKIIKLDEKGRIIVPALTDVKSQDKLILEKDNNYGDGALKISDYKLYANIREKLIKLRDSNIDNMDLYRKYNYVLEQINNAIMYIALVDNQNRIQIPKNIILDLGWDTPGNLQFDGLGESFTLKKIK